MDKLRSFPNIMNKFLLNKSKKLIWDIISKKRSHHENPQIVMMSMFNHESLKQTESAKQLAWKIRKRCCSSSITAVQNKDLLSFEQGLTSHGLPLHVYHHEAALRRSSPDISYLIMPNEELPVVKVACSCCQFAFCIVFTVANEYKNLYDDVMVHLRNTLCTSSTD